MSDHRWIEAGLGIVLACLGGCGDDASGSGGTSDPTAGDPTAGDPTAGDPTAGGDPLQACRELPEAAAAQWVEGTSEPPTGQSTPERMATAGARTWELALDLLTATDADHSLAASPTSMSLALGMTERLYTDMECGASIRSRMHYAEEGDALHQTLGASLRMLEERSLPASADGEDPVIVTLAASIWDLRGTREPEPVYGAPLHQVTGDLAAIRTVMNCVIEAQSRGLLVDFLPPSIPASDTTSIDLDVGYLQAPWSQGLEDRGMQPFTRDDGTVVSLPTMGEDVSAGWYQDEQLTAVDVPLRGGALSVLFVLPAAAGDLGAFTASLDSTMLAAVRDSASSQPVALRMPKVDIPSETLDYYGPLGFECEIFTLRKVLHGAAVQMDEHGVKAAAATAAESWDSGAPEFYSALLDRPFLFFVYDHDTEFVLYSGRFAG